MTKKLIYFNKKNATSDLASALSYIKELGDVEVCAVTSKDLVRIAKEYSKEEYYLLFTRTLTGAEMELFESNPVQFYRENMDVFRESIYF